jgi:hypothetical protein
MKDAQDYKIHKQEKNLDVKDVLTKNNVIVER